MWQAATKKSKYRKQCCLKAGQKLCSEYVWSCVWKWFYCNLIWLFWLSHTHTYFFICYVLLGKGHSRSRESVLWTSGRVTGHWWLWILLANTASQTMLKSVTEVGVTLSKSKDGYPPLFFIHTFQSRGKRRHEMLPSDVISLFVLSASSSTSWPECCCPCLECHCALAVELQQLLLPGSWLPGKAYLPWIQNRGELSLCVLMCVCVSQGKATSPFVTCSVCYNPL